VEPSNAVDAAGEHPGWARIIEGWQRAGLLRDASRDRLAPIVAHPPSMLRAAQALAIHYDADGDPVERAWRAQSDRYLELPDDFIAPESIATIVGLILPEQVIAMERLEDGLELRMAADEEGLETTEAVVFLRRMRTHSRRGLVLHESVDDLPARSLVYALNVLLGVRGSPLRFVPLIALPGRRAWVAARIERAAMLHELHTIAPDESWQDFACYPPEQQLALAS
jgi:hypothetical protein